MTVRRMRPIFASDVRRLGGIVSVRTGRDRTEGSTYYTVHHVSRGGDVAFESQPIPDEDRATAAATVLAAFTGAEMRRL